MDKDQIRIEVAYATPRQQAIVTLSVDTGTTLLEAIELSAIRSKFPDMERVPAGVGIFGQKVTPDHVLQDGDRVEIYRPLTADPKEVRRERAKKG